MFPRVLKPIPYQLALVGVLNVSLNKTLFDRWSKNHDNVQDGST